jgi:hypothetical protein
MNEDELEFKYPTFESEADTDVDDLEYAAAN